MLGRLWCVAWKVAFVAVVFCASENIVLPVYSSGVTVTSRTVPMEPSLHTRKLESLEDYLEQAFLEKGASALESLLELSEGVAAQDKAEALNLAKEEIALKIAEYMKASKAPQHITMGGNGLDPPSDECRKLFDSYMVSCVTS